MIRRPPRSTQSRSSAASDVYKRQSLDGSSTYKLWNFNIGSTIRCLNCHAGGVTSPTADPPLPLPGSALAPHTSSNRGILLENYRDRVLKSTGEAYSAADFALCYVCHALSLIHISEPTRLG